MLGDVLDLELFDGHIAQTLLLLTADGCNPVAPREILGVGLEKGEHLGQTAADDLAVDGASTEIGHGVVDGQGRGLGRQGHGSQEHTESEKNLFHKTTNFTNYTNYYKTTDYTDFTNYNLTQILTIYGIFPWNRKICEICVNYLSRIRELSFYTTNYTNYTNLDGPLAAKDVLSRIRGND